MKRGRYFKEMLIAVQYGESAALYCQRDGDNINKVKIIFQRGDGILTPSCCCTHAEKAAGIKSNRESPTTV